MLCRPLDVCYGVAVSAIMLQHKTGAFLTAAGYETDWPNISPREVKIMNTAATAMAYLMHSCSIQLQRRCL